MIRVIVHGSDEEGRLVEYKYYYKYHCRHLPH